MAITKKEKQPPRKVDKNKVYSLREASSLVKEVNIHEVRLFHRPASRLGVDPKKADQSIRGTVSLPHGTGKTKKVLVLCTPRRREADLRGRLAPIMSGWTEFIQKIPKAAAVDVDVIVATPSVMPKIH